MKAIMSMRRNYISIILLAVFFFVFLGTEYLFDNCMMHVTDMDGVVRAQNYVLGVSAVGFFLYQSAAEFFATWRIRLSAISSLLLFGIDIICVIGVLYHAGYMQTIYAGCILFLNLGILGVWVHAAGTVDIAQWPRLLLAVSGIAAGFL